MAALHTVRSKTLRTRVHTYSHVGSVTWLHYTLSFENFKHTCSYIPACREYDMAALHIIGSKTLRTRVHTYSHVGCVVWMHYTL